MKKLGLLSGKVLVIVAHPDDETIWMGGTIIRHRNVKWTILSLCRRSDPDRAPKFKRAARFYRARGIIRDTEDEGRLLLRESVPVIQSEIRRALGRIRYDYIFTHAADGEYGHPRHKGVHRVVKNLVKNKKIAAGKVFYFAYRLDENKKTAVPEKKADFYVRLTKKEFRAKRKIIADLYGFGKDSFEYKSCFGIETFNSQFWRARRKRLQKF